MDSPLRNGGGSWIAPEKTAQFMDHPRPVAVHGSPPKTVAVHGSIAHQQWRFMDRPPTVAVHGSPTNSGGSWITPENGAIHGTPFG